MSQTLKLQSKRKDTFECRAKTTKYFSETKTEILFLISWLKNHFEQAEFFHCFPIYNRAAPFKISYNSCKEEIVFSRFDAY